MNLNYRLAEFFVNKELFNSSDAANYINQSTTLKTSLYKYLTDSKTLDEEKVYRAVAEYFGLNFYSTSVFSIDENLIKNIPLIYIKENRLIPVFKDEETKNVLVVIDDPYRLIDLQTITYFIKDPIEVRLATPTYVTSLLNYIDNKTRRADAMNAIENEIKPNKEESFDASLLVNAPTVKLTDSILREATAMQASDIHIEPFADFVRVRFRVDGALYTNSKLPVESYPAVLARIKIMAELDISERRIPQDGKISLEIDGKKYDYRVSTLPTIYGEKIVIRIFDTSDDHSNIEQLGLNPEQEKKVKRMISYPHGILLLTGPTGSGKTTTLYSFLKHLNNDEVNITTIEDPVENNLDGVNQIQVNPKVNLTFAASLRSILRQDPNVIMIGEIRDEETAEIAVKAAITGHLVLSTLHTNNAHGTISRLIDMGIPRYLVADALIGAISQRLVRKLCPYCKKEHITTESEMADLGLTKPEKIYEPCGCQRCNGTGYHGRTAVFEILNLNSNIKKSIEDPNFSMDNIFRTCIENGMIPLQEAAKQLVMEGKTSYSEFIALLDNESAEYKL